MTEEQREYIENMTHEDLCRYWRFGHKKTPALSDNLSNDAWLLIRKRLFDDFGGFTPDISKKIGW